MSETPEDFEYQYQREITCPYCLKTVMDSWEKSDEGDIICSGCGGEYTYERDVDVTYVSEKKDTK